MKNRFFTFLPQNFFVHYKRKNKATGKRCDVPTPQRTKSPPPSKGDRSLPALAATLVVKIEMNPKM